MNPELETLNLVLHEEFRLVDHSWSRLAEAVVRERLAYLKVLEWPTSTESLSPVQELVVTSCSFDNRALTDAEQLLARRFPRAVATVEREIPVRFWANNYSRPRTIATSRWSEIAGNYPPRVALELSRLFASSFVPADGGRLILWHGPPGLGKTHALRALGWEWYDWCDLDYVTDPESFFGAAEYMLDVLLDHEDEERWRLLVLEDTGELLSADAKARTGQGLSRFLNVVDGLLGQGLRLLVLVTTNEELRRLHEAVARPGRCAAIVEFRTFTADEATAWLEQRGVVSPHVPPATLAELFALAEGRGVAAPQAPVGFAAESPA
jgi:hypothetical protein